MNRHAEWSRGTLRVEATRQFGPKEYRCLIHRHAWSDSDPDVKFARRSPDADLDVLSDWSTCHYKALSGPTDLASWRSFFAVFEAAFDAYQRAIEVSDYYNRRWSGDRCPQCDDLGWPSATIDLTAVGDVTERCDECGYEPADDETEPAAEETGGRVEGGSA